MPSPREWWMRSIATASASAVRMLMMWRSHKGRERGRGVTEGRYIVLKELVGRSDGGILWRFQVWDNNMVVYDYFSWHPSRILASWSI